MAYALYPEVAEKHFALQADYALLNNRAAARAYREGNLPPLHRLDFDMAEGRGTLVNIKSLDRLWLPHFARCLEPALNTDLRLIWHCDGNLMQMVPRLLEVGIKGFQGFQYEFGMDYEQICAMKTKDGEDLVIMGGAVAFHAIVGRVEMAPSWLSEFNTVLEFCVRSELLADVAQVIEVTVLLPPLFVLVMATIIGCDAGN